MTSISHVSHGVLNTHPLLQSLGKKRPEIVTVCVPSCWLLLGPDTGFSDSCPSGGQGGLSQSTTGLGGGVVVGIGLLLSGIGTTGSSGGGGGGGGGAEEDDDGPTAKGAKNLDVCIGAAAQPRTKQLRATSAATASDERLCLWTH